MAWVLTGTITPTANYQYSGAIESGVCRIRHRIAGQLAQNTSLLTLRSNALLGIGSDLAGLVTIENVRRIYTHRHFEVIRFDYLPEYGLEGLVIFGQPWVAPENWQIEIQEWV